MQGLLSSSSYILLTNFSEFFLFLTKPSTLLSLKATGKNALYAHVKSTVPAVYIARAKQVYATGSTCEPDLCVV